MVRVLVVEDEANIREMIALNLRLTGMEAVEAESAEAALPLLALPRLRELRTAMLELHVLVRAGLLVALAVLVSVRAGRFLSPARAPAGAVLRACAIASALDARVLLFHIVPFFSGDGGACTRSRVSRLVSQQAEIRSSLQARTSRLYQAPRCAALRSFFMSSS